MDESNPYGKTAEQNARCNRWFAVALALGEPDDFLEMLRVEGEVRARALMHPDRMGKSKYVKVLPWYYTAKRRRSRRDERRSAIVADLKADD